MDICAVFHDTTSNMSEQKCQSIHQINITIPNTTITASAAKAKTNPHEVDISGNHLVTVKEMWSSEC